MPTSEVIGANLLDKFQRTFIATVFCYTRLIPQEEGGALRIHEMRCVDFDSAYTVSPQVIQEGLTQMVMIFIRQCILNYDQLSRVASFQ